MNDKIPFGTLTLEHIRYNSLPKLIMIDDRYKLTEEQACRFATDLLDVSLMVREDPDTCFNYPDSTHTWAGKTILTPDDFEQDPDSGMIAIGKHCNLIPEMIDDVILKLTELKHKGKNR